MHGADERHSCLHVLVVYPSPSVVSFGISFEYDTDMSSRSRFLIRED